MDHNGRQAILPPSRPNAALKIPCLHPNPRHLPLLVHATDHDISAWRYVGQLAAVAGEEGVVDAAKLAMSLIFAPNAITLRIVADIPLLRVQTA
jgi:hypothetical protein